MLDGNTMIGVEMVIIEEGKWRMIEGRGSDGSD